MSDLSMKPSLIEYVQSAGYKNTPTRRAILQAIEEAGDHLDPIEVHERAKELHPSIGRATVYRTLELLTELQIVRPIYVGGNKLTYIHAQGGHHHLVCASCGLIIDFDDCMAQQLSERLAEQFNFTIQSHLLEFYGTCIQCS